MDKKIKFIGFYDIDELSQKRMSALSAINKMNYVIDTLNNNCNIPDSINGIENKMILSNKLPFAISI